MHLKLSKHIVLHATLKTETGLRIGGSTNKVEIGGVDNPIIRDPLTGKPYIPGSSMKGKMRTLLEYDLGLIKDEDRGNPHSCGLKSCPIDRIFGPDVRQNLKVGPTRLIARDMRVSGKFAEDDFPSIDLVELKHETAIDRITGTALRGSLRDNERIPAGVTFDMEIVFRCFEFDDGGVSDESLFKKHVPRALELLEMDCLGGYGSRGYGKVSLSGLTLKEDDKVVGEWPDVAGFKAWAVGRG